MAEQYTQEDLNEAYFTQLVFSLQTAAMHQMGKIVNPLTGEVEKNMEQAKHTIDMLAMLEAKTKGNLNEREQKLIERVLFELRMNYVDEMKVVEEEGEEGKEGREEDKAAERKTSSKAKRQKKETASPQGDKKAKTSRKKKP